MNKLAPERSRTGLLPAIATLIVFVLSIIYFGVKTGYNVLGIAFWIMAVIHTMIYFKTHNTGYLVTIIYLAGVGIFVLSIDVEALRGGQKLSPASATLGVFIIFLMLWMLYLMLTRQLKWKGRDILELAASSVNETSNGFTDRPKPAGKAAFTIDEITGFAKFLAKNLVCLSYYSGNKIYLIPVRYGQEYGIILSPAGNLLQRSWISFYQEGNVAVQIRKQDYLSYRDTLSFDQLCDSMGKLFIEFLELYKRGEGRLIINKLDGSKMNIFT